MVPSDFSAVASPNVPSQRVQGEQSNATTTTIKRGTNQVVRVGNILQVVPTANYEWNSTRQGSGASAQAPANIPMMGPVPIPMTHAKLITSPLMHQIPRPPFVKPTLPLPVVLAQPVPPVPPVPVVKRETPKKGKILSFKFFFFFCIVILRTR